MLYNYTSMPSVSCDASVQLKLKLFLRQFNSIVYVRFADLTAVTVKVPAFWNATPYS
jgi:hypothetical protein